MNQRQHIAQLLAKYLDQQAIYKSRREALARDRKALAVSLFELLEQASCVESVGIDVNITGLED
jgi:predicted RNA binding protein with dsRBD fold (UPF0201 family)